MTEEPYYTEPSPLICSVNQWHLLCKSVALFLCDRDLRHDRVKRLSFMHLEKKIFFQKIKINKVFEKKAPKDISFDEILLELAVKVPRFYELCKLW